MKKTICFLDLTDIENFEKLSQSATALPSAILSILGVNFAITTIPIEINNY